MGLRGFGGSRRGSPELSWLFIELVSVVELLRGLVPPASRAEHQGSWGLLAIHSLPWVFLGVEPDQGISSCLGWWMW